jgi:hypothetical protein
MRATATPVLDSLAGLAPGREAVIVSYLGNPDEVAHAVGTGAEYVAAVERADTRLGRIVAAGDSVRAGLDALATGLEQADVAAHALATFGPPPARTRADRGTPVRHTRRRVRPRLGRTSR